MFSKILIANRGEIAVRVARTARRLGIATVAVYSDADAAAPHVSACDEAVRIGAAAPADSYLRIDRLLDAITRTGAEAVHPGYGFLSENADFADALEREGVTFIGPRAETIRLMGSKSASKDLMEAAGVPTTPGYQGADQSFDTIRREAAEIGYPVLLKATAGGGGKGMRVVEEEAALAEALASAQREALSSFGDDRVLIERFIARARHLEVQIVGDGDGNVVHFFERDCSVQRRHQKIIEEAPAPALPANVRARLHDIGVNAGKAVDYRGAGTIECLYDGDEGVYFMEMNTRLQVEHPVTEMITGADLVEWQLRVAAGEGLPMAQDAIKETGHAFEARLYAENPDNNFAPSIGTLTTLALPTDEARIDSGVAEGQAVTPYYDPMIAKIITHGASRAEALGRLRGALAKTRVAGLETNARFLARLAAHPAFIGEAVSTRFIDDHQEHLFPPASDDDRALASAFIAHIQGAMSKSDENNDPWTALGGFRLNKKSKTVFWILQNGAPTIVRLFTDDDRFGHGNFEAEIEPNAAASDRREGYNPSEKRLLRFSGAAHGDQVTVAIDGETAAATVAPHNMATGLGAPRTLRVWIGAEHWDIAFIDPLAGAGGQLSAGGSLNAPMPGVVTALTAAPGDEVEVGDTLMVMEAMKMEHAIKAPERGVIKAFRFQPGEQVKDGDLLLDFEANE